GGFQQVRRDAFALGDDLRAGNVQRRAANGNRARPERAGADRHGGGIAFDDADALERYAELRGDKLRISGRVALPMAVRAQLGGMRLRRRISARSMPSSRAAWSARRSST